MKIINLNVNKHKTVREMFIKFNVMFRANRTEFAVLLCSDSRVIGH